MAGAAPRLILAAVAVQALAGCGSAGDATLQTVPTTPAATTTAPAAPRPAATGPAQPPAASPSGSGGSRAPAEPGGTPAERSQRDFERYCETHPRACED
jgi:hypothetical protein